MRGSLVHLVYVNKHAQHNTRQLCVWPDIRDIAGYVFMLTQQKRHYRQLMSKTTDLDLDLNFSLVLNFDLELNFDLDFGLDFGLS